MKPRFIDEMRNITVEVGRDVTFTCTVSDIHVSTVGQNIIATIKMVIFPILRKQF